jgi:protein dithiol:quinone oxidoreductase
VSSTFVQGLLAQPAERPRRLLALIAVACTGLLAFGIYLQHVVGLEPCPMCIVQRYALILVGVLAAVGSAVTGPSARRLLVFAGLAATVFGAFVAARQSWLQWYPPEVLSCGRDLFGMIESFPLKRVIPMVFRGSGDCSAVDWTFLGLTIANWSFLWFCAMGLVMALVAWRGPSAAGRARTPA